MNEPKLWVELVTAFTADIGMDFGHDKCANINIKKVNKVALENSYGKDGLG